LVIAECNNSTTFPGIGLGAILSRTRLLPPAILVAATRALASQAPALKNPKAGLLPDVTDVREISVQIAKAVIRTAQKEGLNEEKDIPEDDDELEEWIREQMWDPVYRPLNKVNPQEADAHALGETGTGSVRRGAK
jgi:malate dehydrogenase (oxaloacetate-decarboxylating)